MGSTKPQDALLLAPSLLRASMPLSSLRLQLLRALCVPAILSLPERNGCKMSICACAFTRCNPLRLEVESGNWGEDAVEMGHGSHESFETTDPHALTLGT